MENRIVKLIILTIICFSLNKTIAIESINEKNFIGEPNVFPSTPETYKLANFVDIPVNKYTGLPTINIPLYKIEERGIEIPIFLNYHASGIRVKEEATWVGLGWNLNAGGIINQIVNGLRDQYLNGYKDIVLPNNPEGKPNYITENEYLSGITHWNCPLLFGNGEMGLVYEWLSGTIDGQADMYNFSFNGYNGKFFYNRQLGKFVTSDMQPINISLSNGNWSITTPDGTQYIFEIAYDIRNNDLRTNKVNLLTKIVTNFNEEISFIYDKGNYVYNPWNHIEKYVKGGNGDLIKQGFIEHNSRTGFQSKYLSKIEFNNGSVEFLRGSRDDIKDSERLEQILISNKNGTVVKTIDFKYSYFDNGNPTGYIQIGSEDHLTSDYLLKRLRLDGLSINDKNYRFLYNEDVKLPSKYSYAIDYWGYYNGNNTNNKLIPDLRFFWEGTDISANNLVIGYNGSDRRASERDCQAGILKEIVYPTGGKRKFDYELNSFSNFPISSKYSVSNSINKAYVSNYSGVQNSSNNSPFEIQIRKKVNLKINIELPKNFGNYSYLERSNIYCRLMKLETDKWVEHSVWRPKMDKNNFKADVYLELMSGTYKLEAKMPDITIYISKGEYYDLSIYSEYSILLENHEREAISHGAGLRVKRMTDVFENGKEIQRLYKYEGIQNEKPLSYGLLMSPPSFYSRYIQRYLEVVLFNHLCDAVKSTKLLETLSSQTFSPVSNSTSGNYVGYSKVIEYNNIDGSIEYQYKNRAVDFIKTTKQILEIPFVDNGQLIKKIERNTDSIIVRETINEYKKINTSRNESVIFERTNIGQGCCGDFIVYHVPIFNELHVLVNSFTNEYLKPKMFQKKKDFKYYSNGLLKEKTFYGSKEIKRTAYGYPFNYSNEPYKSMVQKNQINQFMKKETFINNNSISTWKSNYINKNGIFLIGSIEEKLRKTDLPLTNFSYYNSGNLKESIKENNIPTYYLWAYHNQYPVVKIVSTNSSLDVSRLQSYIDTITFSGGKTINEVSKDVYNLQNVLKSVINSNDYHVTLHTYSPLVGMTSKTDPAGKTTYYEYDAFGRLQSVKDLNGNILNYYKYHYTNQK